MQPKPESPMGSRTATGDTVSGRTVVDPPVRCLGEYELWEVIGGGGQGQVSRGRKRGGGPWVAIKEWALLPDLKTRERQRPFQEIEALRSVQHPSCVAYLDSGQDGNSCYLVMELVFGDSLADVALREGPLSVDRVCTVARQTALGLQHLFEKRLVHRDIKPANLMWTTEGTVKIVDFGLARQVSDDDAARLTRTHARFGTFDYMATEQFNNSKDADIRSDLYSLGCTLYHLLVGHPPFHGRSDAEKLIAHHQEIPMDVRKLRPEVPAVLAGLVAWMLAKRREDRPQTPADVIAVLDGKQEAPSLLQRAGQGTAGGPDASEVQDLIRASQKRRRRRLLLGAALLLFPPIVGAGISWPRPREIPEPQPARENPAPQPDPAPEIRSVCVAACEWPSRSPDFLPPPPPAQPAPRPREIPQPQPVKETPAPQRKPVPEIGSACLVASEQPPKIPICKIPEGRIPDYPLPPPPPLPPDPLLSDSGSLGKDKDRLAGFRPDYWLATRSFLIPFALDESRRAEIESVVLYVSRDGGRSYERVMKAAPQEGRFQYQSMGDGLVWFAVQAVFRDGRCVPQNMANVLASLSVGVDTLPPSVKLEAAREDEYRAHAKWQVDDENLDLASLQIDLRRQGKSWAPISSLKSGEIEMAGRMEKKNEILFKLAANEQIEIRLSVKDLAGNRTEKVVTLKAGTQVSEAAQETGKTSSNGTSH